jgi:hypothetical protein
MFDLASSSTVQGSVTFDQMNDVWYLRAYGGWSATSTSGGEVRIPRLPHHPRQSFHPFNYTSLTLFNQVVVDMGD